MSKTESQVISEFEITTSATQSVSCKRGALFVEIVDSSILIFVELVFVSSTSPLLTSLPAITIGVTPLSVTSNLEPLDISNVEPPKSETDENLLVAIVDLSNSRVPPLTTAPNIVVILPSDFIVLSLSVTFDVPSIFKVFASLAETVEFSTLALPLSETTIAS